MLRPRLLRIAAACLCVSFVAARAAQPDVAVSDGRISVIMASRPAAGYFQMTNNGDAPVTLTGASAPDCQSLMLHKSSNIGGMSSMQMVGSVAVPAHGTIRFEPGGYHLMCMNPAGPLLADKGTEQVTLEFAGGGKVQVPFAITGVRR